jgi:hypothetical protein
VSAETTDGRLLWAQKNEEKTLARLFQPLGSRSSSGTQVTLKPSESGVLFLFPDFLLSEGRPDRFVTSITAVSSGEHGGFGSVHLAPIRLDLDAPIEIESPLQGANWMAVNGPSNTSDHRRAIIYYDGHPYIGQRYAIDWVMLGPDGATYKGAEHENSSYYAWDREVHAVADGKIVAIKDGIPENVPNSGKLAVQISDDTVAGNNIIEDLGGGHFAAYAHLRPGSLKVKTGDTVHAGDVIAHLGNTGNSSEPHLHFQVCDAPSFLKSEGLPFAINQFTHQEYKIIKRPSRPRLILGAIHQVTREEPLEEELDTFSGK